MATIWVYARSLAIGVAVFFGFRYLGGFSSAQSWALATIAFLGYVLYMDLRARVRAGSAFSPFWVSVGVNWYELLRDFKIVQSDEETFWDDADSAWSQLQVKIGEGSVAAYRALRDDIVFTVLKPGPFDGLIYWNSRRIFRSEVDLEERIEEIKGPSPALGWKCDWSPSAYFKWGVDGYELGLEVNAGWWEQTCAADGAKQLVKVRTDPQHLTGTTRLAVAILPYSEFGIYTEGNAPAPWYDAATLKGRDAELAKAGWKREEKDAELDLLGAPDCIKHRYFSVSHRAI